MNFYETQMGHHFFNSQLPQLIQALERIAASLSGPLSHTGLPEAEDSDILHELYYGLYEPDLFQDRKTLTSLDQQVMQQEKALTAMLEPEALEQLESYQTAVSQRNSAAAEQAYKAGFRLAVELLLAGRRPVLHKDEHERGQTE